MTHIGHGDVSHFVCDGVDCDEIYMSGTIEARRMIIKADAPIYEIKHFCSRACKNRWAAEKGLRP